MTSSPHFKPSSSALVLIDHQVGTTQLNRNITSDQSIRNAVVLGKTALAFNMPIVVTSSMEDHIQGRSIRRSSGHCPKPTPCASNGPASSTRGMIPTLGKPSKIPPGANS
jgi:nicotinamidase-related amidase